MTIPTNEHGNVDMRSGPPSGLVHVPGRRLAVTCAAAGIKCAPALVGWTAGKWAHPLFDGVVVAQQDHSALLLAIERRNGNRKSPAQRRACKRARQAADAARLAADILAEFPEMLTSEAAQCARHATEIGSGRVGRSASAEDPVECAVSAWVRHQHTDYEETLSSGEDRGDARWAVAESVRDILNKWRGSPPV